VASCSGRCAREGVTQFLDIGSGLPTNQNVHEIAQRINADSRVVYAEVVAHARALLSVARLREVMAPGSYLLISHADVSQAGPPPTGPARGHLLLSHE
jgi:hypothetical protein